MRVGISIIIVNWNTKDYLRRCLASIYRNLPSCKCEIIVVDNASSDGSVEMVRSLFPEVKLIVSETNLGFARGNNIGFQNARGEFVFVLNPDTIVLPGCLESLFQFMRANPEAGVIGPWIRERENISTDSFQNGEAAFLDEKLNVTREVSMPERWNNRFGRVRIPNSIGSKFIKPHTNPTVPLEVDWVLNAASFFRRRDVDRDFLMDETFFIGTEEIEFCCGLMKRKGLKCFILPYAQIIHWVGKSYSGRINWAARLHQLAQAAIYFRREQLYGSFWARCDSLVALWDHSVLSLALKLKNLYNYDEERENMQRIYRSLLRTDISLILGGRDKALQIGSEFREWASRNNKKN
ncbi:glycosyltransferase family 2 protein [Pyrinomonas methylaliphatogenes]|uniref:Predicted glycosyltransferase n=1 Tax=Pyrinomonas methylaliphatogenes TaxID=454194 RepID=A0A0B6WUZ8_9BACT|nr:glycosyltransferase family 2 protein [Pyrinomonas methylaliphatogenes]CDM65088.1 predicted glycosyltransferase [Pyrinomonas methylaliphatogenes]